MLNLLNSFLRECWFGPVFSTQWLVRCNQMLKFAEKSQSSENHQA